MRSDAGASALEFGLVIPVLLIILFGIIEFGVIFQHQLALTHAAREGARMAAIGKWDEPSVQAAAFPVDPVITTDPTPVSAALRGQPIKVTLTYKYDWTFIPVPGSIDLVGVAVMRRE